MSVSKLPKGICKTITDEMAGFWWGDNEEEIGNLGGIKVCRSATTISHLLFVDDSLILMKANMQCANTLKRILDTYCSSSGQMVSNAKSSIFLSPNTPVGIWEEVYGELHIVTEALLDK